MTTIHPHLVIAYLTECTLTSLALQLAKRGHRMLEITRYTEIAQYGVDYLRNAGLDSSQISHLPRLGYLLQTDNRHVSVADWVDNLRSVLPR